MLDILVLVMLYSTVLIIILHHPKTFRLYYTIFFFNLTKVLGLI
jgi:uncharacterized membrane protein